MPHLFTRSLSRAHRAPLHSRAAATATDDDASSASPYDALLEGDRPTWHRRTHSTPRLHLMAFQEPGPQRQWLGAEQRPSWTGEPRPPARKLVKDPSGSARPSFSVEISDGSDGEKEKGVVRRKMERLKELYRGVK